MINCGQEVRKQRGEESSKYSFPLAITSGEFLMVRTRKTEFVVKEHHSKCGR